MMNYESLFAATTPPAVERWQGFPEYNFIGGHNDPEQVPVDGFVAAAQRVLRARGRELATYHLDAGPLGDLALRRFVARKLSEHRGARTSPDDVLITSGSMQGIELVNEALLKPGDTVVTEFFSYQGVLNSLRRRGVKVVGVALDEHGLRTDKLAEALAELRRQGVSPKYVYTIPTIQNPTGTVLGRQRRRELLELSETYGVPVFEDECYADLLWEGEWPTSVLGLDDGAGRVVHVGSFSKCLAPALRLGYLVAPWEMLGRLLACKGDGGTGALEQMVTADFFEGHYREHARRLAGTLQRKARALAAALDEYFGTAAEYVLPHGGMFLWIRLPAGVDTRALLEPARAAGIAFNEGPAWCADPEDAANYMRLCFALPSEARIREGVAKLAEVFQRETGIPARSANVALS